MALRIQDVLLVNTLPLDEASHGYHHFITFECDEFYPNLMCKLYLHTGSIHPAHAFVSTVAEVQEFLTEPVKTSAFEEKLVRFDALLGDTKMQDNCTLYPNTLRQNFWAKLRQCVKKSK